MSSELQLTEETSKAMNRLSQEDMVHIIVGLAATAATAIQLAGMPITEKLSWVKAGGVAIFVNVSLEALSADYSVPRSALGELFTQMCELKAKTEVEKPEEKQ